MALEVNHCWLLILPYMESVKFPSHFSETWNPQTLTISRLFNQLDWWQQFMLQWKITRSNFKHIQGLSSLLEPYLPLVFFPKQFTVGVLNAVLSVSALAGMLCLPRWSCLSLVSGLVFQLVSHLVWDAVSASPVVSFSCLRPCLPACLPSGLGCCFRLAGRVFLLSPVLSPSLSPIWSGMLCPPRWSCLSLVSGLVSQLVSHLVWDAVSAALVLSFSYLRSCLPACFPSGLGCCVFRAGLVFSLIFGLVSQLVSHLFFLCGLGCCVGLAGRVFLLSPVLSPSLSPIWSGMLCPPLPLSPVFSPSLSPIWFGMLCLPRWSCLSLIFSLVSQLVSHLVSAAVSASLFHTSSEQAAFYWTDSEIEFRRCSWFIILLGPHTGQTLRRGVGWRDFWKSNIKLSAVRGIKVTIGDCACIGCTNAQMICRVFWMTPHVPRRICCLDWLARVGRLLTLRPCANLPWGLIFGWSPKRNVHGSAEDSQMPS